jgi:hypothetical protein
MRGILRLNRLIRPLRLFGRRRRLSLALSRRLFPHHLELELGHQSGHARENRRPRRGQRHKAARHHEVRLSMRVVGQATGKEIKGEAAEAAAE